VMLPTRVHERYISLCLPFLVLVAAGMPRWRWGVAGLIVVACFQMTVYHWLTLGSDSWSRRYKDQTIEHYEEAVRNTPPAQRNRLPKDVDEALALRLPNFIKEQQKFRPYEWAVTILSLLSAVLVAAAAVIDAAHVEPGVAAAEDP